jgi:hypothetical protein
LALRPPVQPALAAGNLRDHRMPDERAGLGEENSGLAEAGS